MHRNVPVRRDNLNCHGTPSAECGAVDCGAAVTPARRSPVRWFIAVIAGSACAGCAPPPPPPVRDVGSPLATLEVEVTQLGNDPAPGPTVRRSRVLRALGRQ